MCTEKLGTQGLLPLNRNVAINDVDDVGNGVARTNNGHTASLSRHATAYYHEFYECSFKNCRRSIKRFLQDHIIYPLIKCATIFLGFTVLLPYSLYLAATRQQQKQSLIKSETMNDFINLNVNIKSNIYFWQVRAKAQQIDEENKGTCRHCCEIGLPITWSLIGVNILVNKVENWLYYGKLTEAMHLHEQTLPMSADEARWADQIIRVETSV
ncbi:MAG: hypothetical protein KAG53_02680 [Endozoicomonadaceae bacterium]|nr:hypothetical protein [Endozoicomonadaceae bacterium]